MSYRGIKMIKFSKLLIQHPVQYPVQHPVQPQARPLWVIAISAAVLGLVGCAAAPIKPSYVPATDYRSLNCDGLRAEHARIGMHIEQGVPEERSLFSGVNLGLGAFGGSGLGWGWSPSVSFSAGQHTASTRAAHARLLGQQEAVSQQAVLQGCPIRVPPTAKS